jgi:hypothetical protein
MVSTMKRIALLKERQAGNAGSATSTATGSHCPVSGRWSPDPDPHTVLSFFEGHVFPTFDGVPTVWRRRTGSIS